jgi:hypothetical protein
MQLGDLPLGRLRDRWPAGPLPLRLSSGHARFYSLAYKRALELGEVRHHAEYELALRRGRVHVLLIADESHSPRLELAERIDECPGRAGEAIVAPDQHHIELALAYGLEKLLVLLPGLGRTGGMVDILPHHAEAAPLGILAQGLQLGLGVLSPILGRYAGVEAGAEVFVGSVCHRGGIKKGAASLPWKSLISQWLGSTLLVYQKGVH